MDNQNRLSTLLGIIIGISSVLVANGLIDEKIGGTVSGVGTVFLGYLVREREQGH
jgi:hypothetical protein